MSDTTDFWTSSEAAIDGFMLSPWFKYVMIVIGALSILSAIVDYIAATNLGTHSLCFLGIIILGAGIIFFLGKHDQATKDAFSAVRDDYMSKLSSSSTSI